MSSNFNKNFFRGNVKVSVCALDQWAMDFTGNQDRIFNAVNQAKLEGGKIILLPELCTSGYSCQDHFYENDTYVLSMSIIKDICESVLTNDIILVLGTPVIHKGVRYNTMTFISNGKIILIRPKISLADDGNYREARWFNSWRRDYNLEDFDLNFPNQKKCKIGVAIVKYGDVKIAAEVCEELWTPQSMNIPLYLNDTDIILNSSGSHFESKKILKRIQLLEAATKRSGGAYLYSNLIGCDGERLYFDGGSLIALNGQIIAEQERFKLVNYQVLTENINLDDIREYRLKGASIQIQSSDVEVIQVIDIEEDFGIKFREFINYNNNNNISNNSERCNSKKIFNFKGNKDIKLFEEKYNKYIDKLKINLGYNSKNNIPIPELKKNLKNMKPNNIKDLHNNTKTLLKYHEKIKNLKEKFAIAKEDFNDIKDAEIVEIVDAAACWMWDYLFRSNSAGFMLPLSGGADSSSVALMVYIMCEKVNRDIVQKNFKPFYDNINWGVINNLKKIQKSIESITANDVCSVILDAVYLPNSHVSGSETETRSKILTESISSEGNWKSHDIKSFYDAAKEKMQDLYKIYANRTTLNTNYRNKGKVRTNNKQVQNLIDYHRKTTPKNFSTISYSLADENIQARLRMLLTYLVAQVITTLKQQVGGKLNLGCSNSDEVLIGYYTKYDASAADLNPIGSLPKKYINKILQYYSLYYNETNENLSTVLFETYIAIPTAELKPDVGLKIQADEDEIGLSYDQVAVIGELRSSGYGLLSIFKKLKNHKLFKKDGKKNDKYLYDKLEQFYAKRYTLNRHKAVIITPCVHLLPSPDDNRFDLRPFLYRTKIDDKIAKLIKPESSNKKNISTPYTIPNKKNNISTPHIIPNKKKLRNQRKNFLNTLK